MRFLANENVPRIAVEALRRAGHDTAWVRIDAPGSPDIEVLSRALREDRVLLTFDKDFGALVFRHGAAASRGVVVFRLPATSPDDLARRVVAAISDRASWDGFFSIVEPGRVRLRRLPS